MSHGGPVFLGAGGIPLFANIEPGIKVKIKEVIPSKLVAYVTREVS